MDKESVEKRLAELREAEGMAWANLHAIQGRIAEADYWLERLNGAWTEGKLQEAIERGAKEEPA